MLYLSFRDQQMKIHTVIAMLLLIECSPFQIIPKEKCDHICCFNKYIHTYIGNKVQCAI